MKIIAVTNREEDIGEFGYINIFLHIWDNNQYRVAIKGTYRFGNLSSGTIIWLIRGTATLLNEHFGDVQVEPISGYPVSAVEIPYSANESTNVEFNFICDVEDWRDLSDEPIASIYRGEKRISAELTRSQVWSKIIPIKLLEFNLIHQPEFLIGEIEPEAESLSPLTKRTILNGLSQDFSLGIQNNWKLSFWRAKQIDLHTPFVLEPMVYIHETYQEEPEPKKEKSNGSLNFFKSCLSKIGLGIVSIMLFALITTFFS